MLNYYAVKAIYCVKFAFSDAAGYLSALYSPCSFVFDDGTFIGVNVVKFGNGEVEFGGIVLAESTDVEAIDRLLPMTANWDRPLL